MLHKHGPRAVLSLEQGLALLVLVLYELVSWSSQRNRCWCSSSSNRSAGAALSIVARTSDRFCLHSSGLSVWSHGVRGAVTGGRVDKGAIASPV